MNKSISTVLLLVFGSLCCARAQEIQTPKIELYDANPGITLASLGVVSVSRLVNSEVIHLAGKRAMR